VVPRDYKRVMELIRTAEAAGRNVAEAVMGVKGA
jgi:glutamate synthase (NADPH/NADH) large chain